jgi:hypothetical protein
MREVRDAMTAIGTKRRFHRLAGLLLYEAKPTEGGAGLCSGCIESFKLIVNVKRTWHDRQSIFALPG